MRSAVARRLSVLGFVLSCAILALIGGSSYQRLAELRDASRAVEHTHEVRTELERVLSLLTDAETGQRGFLLTGVVSYLEPYKAALASLPAGLDRLRRLTADNPRQQTDLAALELLIQRKATELGATIAARETRGFDVAARIVLNDEGKRVMDQIRTAIAAMGAEEQRLLTERTQREERAGQMAVFTTVGGLALALLLGIAATVLLNQAIRQRARAEAARAEAEAVARATAASEEQLRVTLASIGDAVIATDAEGRVTLMNAVAQGLTGWSADDAVRRPLEDVFVILNEVTRRPVENPVDKVLREGNVAGLANHTVVVAKDGREIPIGDSAAPIRTAEGQLLGVVLVFRDVTESRRLGRCHPHEDVRRDHHLLEPRRGTHVRLFRNRRGGPADHDALSARARGRGGRLVAAPRRRRAHAALRDRAGSQGWPAARGLGVTLTPHRRSRIDRWRLDDRARHHRAQAARGCAARRPRGGRGC